MHNIVLRCDSISKYFPFYTGFIRRKKKFIKAVDGISFELKRGEILGIVGESGCGKSTLARTLLLITRSTTGKIIFENQDITNFNEKALKPFRKKMSIIYQDPYASLDPRATIKSIISEPLKIHRMTKRSEIDDRVESMLEVVGLGKEAMSRFPHEFSSGQRQRINIARALILEPELLIADEPTSALDVSVQAKILNLLLKLHDKFKLSIIFISHDLSLVQYLCDSIMVVYLGQVVELAPTVGLESTLLHPYTKALWDSIPIPDPEHHKKSGKLNINEESPASIDSDSFSGCKFYHRCPNAMNKCREVIPTLTKITGGHFVRCHLYN